MHGRVRHLFVLRDGGVVIAPAAALVTASVSILVLLRALPPDTAASFGNAPCQLLAREVSRGVSSSAETAKCHSPREGLLLVRRKGLMRDLLLVVVDGPSLGTRSRWYPQNITAISLNYTIDLTMPSKV
jgi:hypothetical protein